jgi:hypothetical protein
MEKDKKLHNIILIFPQAQQYSLLQNKFRASRVEYDVTKRNRRQIITSLVIQYSIAIRLFIIFKP